MAVAPKFDITDGLLRVLKRASVINARIHTDRKYNLDFTSLLLGFLASDTQWSQLMRRHAQKNKVNIERIAAPLTWNSELLELIAREAEGEVEIARRSPSVKALFKTATNYSIWFGRIPAPHVAERHVLGACIYQPGKIHEAELKNWGFDRHQLSESFLAQVKAVHDDEFNAWLNIHVETFSYTPDIPEPSILPTDREQHTPAEPVEDAAQTAEPSPISDYSSFHLDNPASDDILGRRDFASAIATRLNAVWKDYNRKPDEGESGERPTVSDRLRRWLRRKGDDGPGVAGSFIVHVHGPWGSGKSSLLNLLRRELQSGDSGGADAREGGAGGGASSRKESAPLDWVVVEFNAWQHQRIEPPWWPLMDTIYRQSLRQMGRGPRAWARRCRLRLREKWWRFSTGRRDYLLTIVVSLVVFTIIVCWLLMPEWFPKSLQPPEALKGFEPIVKSLAPIIGAAAAVWSTMLLASRSLLSGSSRSALAFMQSAGDPMERVHLHFRELLGWIDRPVVVFIDDLDRCQVNYVVSLLEGVQTLFNDPRVVYCIAADRRWLHVCFEKVYANFIDVVREPGRRLGSLFLEKAFELSVAVPRLSPTTRRAYWEYLLGGRGAEVEKKLEENRVKARDALGGATTEEQIMNVVAETTGDPALDMARASEAVRRLATRDAVASTENFLLPFAHLLEPNPRAMKRLLNAYTVQRDTALLADTGMFGDAGRRRQLALWTIVSLRWPLLEEYLEENPDEVESIRDGGEANIERPELKSLVGDQEVKDVLGGKGVGARLDKASVLKFIGDEVQEVEAAAPPA